ncbi:hypothetical protein [Klebsiella pneumoniae]|uniref:hypothetical protein n=1 Tax=Klebsiella pneumoniae TaxID=573 RepID=UPI000E2BB063|nr:hypothetical protein [Klebsiella pneumoniae]SXY87882.1 Uncharacterised protein [Klebsiella pneumoniae]VUM45203.1 Uncharacterised protein [Klebsiella pneumoniae]HDS9661343.1 hypothetical protein [Klebsiella pneumoniae subsp. pneumoniae]HED1762374.1 hypothetical protein [Klebsiella pneumoniae]
MTDEKRNSLTADQNEPKQKPDLTLLYKRRCRSDDIIQKAKHLLIAGYSPGRVACLLRLPLDRVMELYENSYNPKCRRFAKQNEHTNTRLALTSFNEGAPLADIAAALGLSLYWVVMSLRQNGVAESAINSRLPPADDPLYVEYRCARDGLTLYRNHKNENNIAKSQRRHRLRASGENSRRTGRRTAPGRCKSGGGPLP